MKYTAFVLALCCAPVAFAQHSDNFESGYTASPAGDDLNGQNGYYNPVAGSVSGKVYTYAGNALGIPQNPNGGKNFIGSTGPGGGVFSRSQKDVTYPTGKVSLTFDILGQFSGTLPATQNMGSVSTQPFPGAGTMIMLATHTNVATGTSWDADNIWYDAAGTQLQEKAGNAAFQNLSMNSWYRWGVTFDVATNQVLEVSIMDITAGTSATYNPVNRYLGGGAAGGGVAPTGFRFFGGGGGPGNTLAFDNLDIIPAPGSIALVALGGLAAIRRRR